MREDSRLDQGQPHSSANAPRTTGHNPHLKLGFRSNHPQPLACSWAKGPAWIPGARSARRLLVPFFSNGIFPLSPQMFVSHCHRLSLQRSCGLRSVPQEVALSEDAEVCAGGWRGPRKEGENATHAFSAPRSNGVTCCGHCCASMTGRSEWRWDRLAFAQGSAEPVGRSFTLMPVEP